MNITDINPRDIMNSTPDDLKALGSARLPQVLMVIGSKIENIIQPPLDDIIQKYINNFTLDKTCPSPEITNYILQQRNLIVDRLNNIGNTLDKVSISLIGVSNFLALIENTLKGIDITKQAASLAALINPALAAALPVVLNTLETSKLSIALDSKYNSKINKLTSIVSNSSLVISIISKNIFKAKQSLDIIDTLLSKCSQSSPTSLSNSIILISQSQQQAINSQNNTTYQGFIIDIEEVPFNNNTNRMRAIGKNSQGIPLIQTELSFTTNRQTLIDELKTIITRDNLKAY